MLQRNGANCWARLSVWPRSLSLEHYRTCGRTGCHCQSGGPKHGPHLNVSYRGEKGKTTGYYVPKEAEQATREGVAAWQQMQQYLRELAELNKERNLRQAREADSR